MTILGIETSCDETSASLVKKQNSRLEVLSNVISSSSTLHSKTGGIIPEAAAREQIKFIIPVIKQVMEESGLDFYEPTIDAIAVTVGPGLIGSLLVGVETAKTLSLVWNKPIICVNHLLGHIYANFIGNPKIDFPALSLIVSGGHTDLFLLKDHGKIKWIGGTRDDAAGEAFDKIGRMLDLPYPGGPTIEKLAAKGVKGKFVLPRPMLNSKDFDFSFSGLKTAVYNMVKNKKLNDQQIKDICLEVQNAIVDVLVKKALKASQKFDVKSLLLGGGVAANQTLRDQLELKIENSKFKIPFFVPEKRLCTDNGAMIAAAAFYNPKIMPLDKIEANPSLYFNTAQ